MIKKLEAQKISKLDGLTLAGDYFEEAVVSAAVAVSPRDGVEWANIVRTLFYDCYLWMTSRNKTSRLTMDITSYVVDFPPRLREVEGIMAGILRNNQSWVIPGDDSRVAIHTSAIRTDSVRILASLLFHLYDKSSGSNREITIDFTNLSKAETAAKETRARLKRLAAHLSSCKEFDLLGYVGGIEEILGRGVLCISRRASNAYPNGLFAEALKEYLKRVERNLAYMTWESGWSVLWSNLTDLVRASAYLEDQITSAALYKKMQDEVTSNANVTKNQDTRKRGQGQQEHEPGTRKQRAAAAVTPAGGGSNPAAGGGSGSREQNSGGANAKRFTSEDRPCGFFLSQNGCLKGAECTTGPHIWADKLTIVKKNNDTIVCGCGATKAAKKQCKHVKEPLKCPPSAKDFVAKGVPVKAAKIPKVAKAAAAAEKAAGGRQFSSDDAELKTMMQSVMQGVVRAELDAFESREGPTPPVAKPIRLHRNRNVPVRVLSDSGATWSCEPLRTMTDSTPRTFEEVELAFGEVKSVRCDKVSRTLYAGTDYIMSDSQAVEKGWLKIHAPIANKSKWLKVDASRMEEANALLDQLGELAVDEVILFENAGTTEVSLDDYSRMMDRQIQDRSELSVEEKRNIEAQARRARLAAKRRGDLESPTAASIPVSPVPA